GAGDPHPGCGAARPTRRTRSVPWLFSPCSPSRTGVPGDSSGEQHGVLCVSEQPLAWVLAHLTTGGGTLMTSRRLRGCLHAVVLLLPLVRVAAPAVAAPPPNIVFILT